MHSLLVNYQPIIKQEAGWHEPILAQDSGLAGIQLGKIYREGHTKRPLLMGLKVKFNMVLISF